MAYLSRIWLNPLRRGAQKVLQNPHAMHAAVVGGIPAQPVTERVLWRLDSDSAHRPTLFVLTRSRPSWEHLVEQASWPGANTPQAAVREYEPLLRRVEMGICFAFRLTANPVQATKHPDKHHLAQERRPGRSVRVGHRTVAHQLRWLLDRTDGWGVQIPPARMDAPAFEGAPGSPAPDVRISARRRVSFRRGPNSRVTLQQVTYEGHLVVQDPARFREVLLAGMGRGKAYGCGLMTLAPSQPGG